MKSKLIYFCSEFPGISHTFIFREIEMLTENGFEITTVSVNFPHHVEKFSAREKLLAVSTLYLKKTPFGKVLFTLLRMAVTTPLETARMAKSAVSLSILKGHKSPKKALGYFIEALLLVAEARRKDIRHIHVHFANPAATVALIASRSGRVDYSLSVHGPDEFYDISLNLLKEKADGAVFIRCISHYCRSQLYRLISPETWDKLSIVRCGVDPALFSPAPPPCNSVPQLLCVGRLTKNKGQHILIDACALLKRHSVPFHLTFVGDGEDKSSLEHRSSALGLADQITFAGAKGQDEVRSLYAASDLFILPSFAEGVPVVLMEAMSMEIPVLSTCINGIPELIDSGENGFLVPPGDPEALFLKIKLLIEDPLLRARLGKRAREKVAECYHLAANCSRLVSIFKETLKSI